MEKKFLDKQGLAEVYRQIKATYPTKSNVVTSVNGKKGDMMVDFFIGDDTRKLNYAPKEYLNGGKRFKSNTNSQFEFKYCNVVGLDKIISQSYCIVNTQVPWKDKAGGLPMQIAYGNGVIAVRESVDESTWNEWKKVALEDKNQIKIVPKTAAEIEAMTETEKNNPNVLYIVR